MQEYTTACIIYIYCAVNICKYRCTPKSEDIGRSGDDMVIEYKLEVLNFKSLTCTLLQALTCTYSASGGAG